MEQRHHSHPSLFRELSTVPDVWGTFERISRLPYPIFFDSAGGTASNARYSFMAATPRTIVRGYGDKVDQTTVYSGTTVRSTGRALDVVATLLEERRALADFYSIASPERTGERDQLPPFQGGAAGFIGYEYGGVLEHVPRPYEGLKIPDVVVGFYDWTIAWDHVQHRCWIFADSPAMLDVIAKMIHGVAPATASALAPASRASEDLSGRASSSTEFTSTFTRPDYETAIERIREYIRAGDIFQANFSQRFSAPLQATPLELYQTLRTINPAPFACYFDAGDVILASASPERFLRVNETGVVETYPIKGTRPRAEDPARDRALRDELLGSEKDAAEHVMIVDVLRNDLARVCEYGSVRVPELMQHEAHTTVHHLVSKVTGQLRDSMTAIDLLQASFPGGSITGAPKIRAMEIIAELEPVTRGVYCGAIGYMSITGAMDTSIAIRTCVAHDKHVYFAAGGGIVADSDPAAEYEETLVKAHALRQAISIANARAHVLAHARAQTPTHVSRHRHRKPRP